MSKGKIATASSVALTLGLLLLAGCHSSVGYDPDAATADSTMLSLKVTGLRAEGEDGGDFQTDAAPINGEGKVSKVDVMMKGRGLLASAETNPELPSNEKTVEALYRIENLRKEEKHDFFVIVNRPKEMLPYWQPEATLGLDELPAMTSSYGFLMTGPIIPSATLTPGVTDPSEENGNYFRTSVERVVSKAQLYVDHDLYNNKMLDVSQSFDREKLNLPGPIRLNEDGIPYIRWAVAGSGKSVFLSPTHAGERKMSQTDQDRWLYSGYKSSASQVSGLTKLSELSSEQTPSSLRDNFAPKYLIDTLALGGVENITPPYQQGPGTYFLEHKVGATNGTPYDPKITYDNIAYAKVYADLDIQYYPYMHRGDYSPSLSLVLTDGPNLVFTSKEEAVESLQLPPKDLTSLKPYLSFGTDSQVDYWYWFEVTEEWYNDHLEKFNADRFRRGEDGRHFFLIHDTPYTFYVGERGGFFGNLLAAAVCGEKHARKYTGGRTVYLTPLNAQGEPGKIYNCDTRRNNIYEITIEGIAGLGYNYDPVDPDDPEIPYPHDNPLEPEPAPAPPVNNNIGLKVKTSVLPWNYFHQSYDLHSNGEEDVMVLPNPTE